MLRNDLQQNVFTKLEEAGNLWTTLWTSKFFETKQPALCEWIEPCAIRNFVIKANHRNPRHELCFQVKWKSRDPVLIWSFVKSRYLLMTYPRFSKKNVELFVLFLHCVAVVCRCHHPAANFLIANVHRNVLSKFGWFSLIFLLMGKFIK